MPARASPGWSARQRPQATTRAAALLRQINDQVVELSSPDAAELAKLLENVFRNVNIAFVNQLALLCERMGLDVWEVINAAATKPFGFMKFTPGPGVGGHCIPVSRYIQQRGDELVRVRGARRASISCGGASGDPYAMLLATVVEQHGLLGDDADLAPQRRQRRRACRRRRSGCCRADVVEARQQIHERRLSRAAAADDGHHLSGADRKRDAAQDPAGALVVAEADVTELDDVAERRERRRAGCSCTSVCVSSISKMRSDAAMACCRFAFTRLSFSPDRTSGTARR